MAVDANHLAVETLSKISTNFDRGPLSFNQALGQFATFTMSAERPAKIRKATVAITHASSGYPGKETTRKARMPDKFSPLAGIRATRSEILNVCGQTTHESAAPRWRLPDDRTSMTVPHLETAAHAVASLRHSPSCRDPETECTIVFARPAVERDLWRDFVRGATRSYCNRGVERALDMDALRTGADTILFAACVDRAGRVVGGLRAKGPYQSADEAHALQEWSGQPGYDAVRKMITDRLPFGVVEMKTAWVTDDPDRSRQLTSAISRTPLHAMGLLDIQFIVATAASYVLKRWLSSGGVLATKIPPTPYPDERYETRLAWWDRRTFANHADPKQLSLYFAEQRRMVPRLDSSDKSAATGTVR